MNSLVTGKQLLSQASAFRTAILSGYRNNGRPLPWRAKPSLYRTVVSEFMCQQTQVATVLPYFERWITILPDFATLAAADEMTVMKLWEGLGYYSRARNLHRLAQQWVSSKMKPQSMVEWLKFPGVGPYTAAAIASITFAERVAVVDGNVVRVLARLTNEQTTYSDSARAVKAFTPLANALIAEAPEPGNHNQAMMELGAVVCTRANPQCLHCLVREFCAGRLRGDPSNLPRLIRKKARRRVVDRVVLVRGGAVLLHRIPGNARRLAGLSELPPAELLSAKLPEQPTLTKRRSIANERIEERFFRLDWAPMLTADITANATLYWQPIGDLGQVTFTGPHRKWLPELLDTCPEC